MRGIMTGDGDAPAVAPGIPLNENENARAGGACWRGVDDLLLIPPVPDDDDADTVSNSNPPCGGVVRVGDRNICGGKLAAVAGPAPQSEHD